jgi:transcriptional regulator with XRE-family HTH domain
VSAVVDRAQVSAGMTGDEPQSQEQMSFGAVLRRHRLAAGLSQEALAELAGMSAQAIGGLERAVNRGPSRETVAHLARALGLNGAQTAGLEAAARRPRGGQAPGRDVNRADAPRADGPARAVLLATKLLIPPARASLIARPRLLARLQAGVRGPLTLLSAPAGCGKTTLLCAWRATPEGRDLPLAWVPSTLTTAIRCASGAMWSPRWTACTPG